LGTAQAKAENWLSQRQDIAKHLTDIRDTASGVLESLAGESPFPWSKLRRRAKARTRKLSAQARAAISAAQKKRRAAYQKSKRKGGAEGNG
jgi:hypothetical protein